MGLDRGQAHAFVLMRELRRLLYAYGPVFRINLTKICLIVDFVCLVVARDLAEVTRAQGGSVLERLLCF